MPSGPYGSLIDQNSWALSDLTSVRDRRTARRFWSKLTRCVESERVPGFTPNKAALSSDRNAGSAEILVWVNFTLRFKSIWSKAEEVSSPAVGGLSLRTVRGV